MDDVWSKPDITGKLNIKLPKDGGDGILKQSGCKKNDNSNLKICLLSPSSS